MLLKHALTMYIEDFASGYYKSKKEVYYHRQNRATWDDFKPELDANDVSVPLFLEWRHRLAKGGLYACSVPLESKARTSVNRCHQTFLRAMTWLMTMEVVNTDTHYRLAHVPILPANRLLAREPTPSDPVPDQIFENTLKHIKTHSLRDVLRLIRLSGMRPGEAVQVHKDDIIKDLEPGVWYYAPGEHKTRYLGHGRFVLFGPRCQEIICNYESKKRLEDGPLFRNDRGNPWTSESIEKRVCYTCQKFNIPQWNPKDLRKGFSNKVFNTYGLQGESATLGHSPETAQKFYLMRDLKLAAQIARDIG